MPLTGRLVMPSRWGRVQVPLQVALYVGLFVLVLRLHLPLPANIVGMFLLLALILLRILPLR